MIPKLYQSPPLVYQRNWMMIKRSACCHHWLQCLRWLEVEMWLLLKRLTSETNPKFLERVEGFSLFEKGLLGPPLLWMVYLVGKYLLLFSETELPELYSLLVCEVLQAMRFKFWIISFSYFLPRFCFYFLFFEPRNRKVDRSLCVTLWFVHEGFEQELFLQVEMNLSLISYTIFTGGNESVFNVFNNPWFSLSRVWTVDNFCQAHTLRSKYQLMSSQLSCNYGCGQFQWENYLLLSYDMFLIQIMNVVTTYEYGFI